LNIEVAKHAWTYKKIATNAKDEILKLQGKVASLQLNNKDLIYHFEKEMKLLNKMRRRISLSMAREKIIKDLGKETFVKGDSWKNYFNAFTILHL
jgi:hypothetical protein